MKPWINAKDLAVATQALDWVMRHRHEHDELCQIKLDDLVDARINFRVALQWSRIAVEEANHEPK
jgi:hypothetical protein